MPVSLRSKHNHYRKGARMGQWAPEGFSKHARETTPQTLRDAVERLTPKARQAFHAAATLGPVAQRTWDGCAFNAGAEQVGEVGVNSFSSAAEVFDMPQSDVQAFIRIWDRLNVDNPTETLKRVLEEAGLFPQPKTFVGRSFVKLIHKSEAEQLDEHFGLIDELRFLEDSEMTSTISEFKEATEEASRYLFA